MANNPQLFNLDEVKDFPDPIVIGTRFKHYYCRMQGCLFNGKSRIGYDAHMDQCHRCIDCDFYIPDLGAHQCPYPGEKRSGLEFGKRLDLQDWKEVSRSHFGLMVTYRYAHSIESKILENNFEILQPSTKKLLEELFEIHRHCKIKFTMTVEFEKDQVLPTGEIRSKFFDSYFKTDLYELVTVNDIERIILNSASQILEQVNEFVNNDSGLSVNGMKMFEVKIGAVKLFKPIKGAGYVPMPKGYECKKGYLSFRNNDSKCFLYCIAAHMFKEDQERENRNNRLSTNRNFENWKTWEKYLEWLNIAGCDSFVDPNGEEIQNFERYNNVRISVLTHIGGEIVLLKKGLKEGITSNTYINLFLIRQKNRHGTKYHYVLIQNINKFLRNNHTNAVCVCIKCFRDLKNKTKLEEHMSICDGSVAATKERFPKEDAVIKFRRPEMTIPYPYVLYYDFEAFSSPPSPECKKRGENTEISKTFTPASYAMCIIYNGGEKPQLLDMIYYDGDNVMEEFYKSIFTLAQKYVQQVRDTNNSQDRSPEDLADFNAATHCSFCNREFTTKEQEVEEEPLVHYCPLAEVEQDEEDEYLAECTKLTYGDEETEDMVTDDEVEKIPTQESLEKRKKSKRVIKCWHHNHTTGAYCGALCNSCNLQIRYKSELVCVAHNGMGFDHHFLMKNINSESFNVEDVDIIAKNSQQIIQMSISSNKFAIPPLYADSDRTECGLQRVNVRFIDSLQFLNKSLDGLVSDLRQEFVNGLPTDKSILNLVTENLYALLPNMSKEQILKLENDDRRMLFGKLPYPYTYLSNPTVLEVGGENPSKEWFHNDLTGKECSDEEYEVVKRLRSVFQLNDFKTFTALYTRMDVILLACVFENFRKNSIKSYGLDPLYSCTLSGYTWHCFLYCTNTQIEYVRDKEMLDMIREGIRGGSAFNTRRITTANNPKNPYGYNKDLPESQIVYFDKVGLYATAMLEKFPQSHYMWVKKEVLEKIDWATYDGEDNAGYLLQVTLEYPPEVQDFTQDLILAPERKKVNLEELGGEQAGEIKRRKLDKSFTTQPRLLLHCYERKQYVVHYKALRYYLSMGLKLKEIHKGFVFQEADFLRPYILYNIEKRKMCTNATESAMYKLMNNAIFGKTLQRVLDNCKIKFCRTNRNARRLLTSPYCQDFQPLTNEISMVWLRPAYVTLDKPLQIGQAVLDISKVIFYDGYYGQLKKVFGETITNLYSDTDSLVTEIKLPEAKVYKKLVEHRNLFDFSKLPPTHEIFTSHPHLTNLRTQNKDRSGLWKIEVFIAEFVALKGKTYSVGYYTNEEEQREMETGQVDPFRKAKGVNRAALLKFKHDNYKDLVIQNSVANVDMTMIRSFQHDIYTVKVNRIGFNTLDVSRCYPYPGDYNTSYPIGYHKLNYILKGME